MKISINGESKTIENNSSLNLLLKTKKLATQKGIAVAINNKVIPHDAWQSHVLSENDAILIIKATKGG